LCPLKPALDPALDKKSKVLYNNKTWWFRANQVKPLPVLITDTIKKEKQIFP
jgi:hypothetical protein